MERRTGKTYRACLRSVLNASENQSTVLVTDNWEHASRFIDQITMPLFSVARINNGRTFQIEGKGFIYLITPKDDFQKSLLGQRINVVEWDKVECSDEQKSFMSSMIRPLE